MQYARSASGSPKVEISQSTTAATGPSADTRQLCSP